MHLTRAHFPVFRLFARLGVDVEFAWLQVPTYQDVLDLPKQ